MEDLRARTEINDAWTNLHLAEALLTGNRYAEAEAARRDAEHHYAFARSGVASELSGSTLNALEDLRVKLGQIESTIRKRTATGDFHRLPADA
jgi:hypothetical protein